MNLEQINEIITNYKKLLALTESKIKILENLDSQYNTARYIEEITFEDNFVNVKCNASCRGYYDTQYFSFPILWLTKTDEELEELIVTERELRKEKERKEKEENRLKEEKEVEQREFEQYQRLKFKFEQYGAY